MTRYFFPVPIFWVQQADHYVEQINNKVSKKIIVLKNPAQEDGGVEGFVYLVLIYT